MNTAGKIDTGLRVDTERKMSIGISKFWEQGYEDDDIWFIINKEGK